MICHKCGGGNVTEQAADLPFRLDLHKILVVKDTPSHICNSCGEIILAQTVMNQIDGIIRNVQDLNAELEVVRYAA